MTLAEKLALINSLRESIQARIDLPPVENIICDIDNSDTAIEESTIPQQRKLARRMSSKKVETELMTFTKQIPVPKTASNLSGLLSKTELDNPMLIYERFSGKNDGQNALQLEIFFPMFDNYKLVIKVKTDTIINDLIGYCLYEYSKDKSLPELPVKIRSDPKDWDLKIAEDGEIDEDFPALDRNRQIKKYQFDQFALIPIRGLSSNGDSDSPNGEAKEEQVFLKIHLYSTLEIKQTTMMHMPLHLTMREIFGRICEKRKYNPKDYILKMPDTKTDVPMDVTLQKMDCIEFCVLKRSSGGAGDIFLRPPDEQDSDTQILDFSSEDHRTMYKQFSVISKSYLKKQDRVLIIDGEYLHLDYIEKKKTAVTFSVSDIKSCQLVKKNSIGVKIVIMRGTEQKLLDLEAPTSNIANEICARITFIMDMASKSR